MNIVLVGFMGTGKTAVAKRVANTLKMDYVSMDSIIEDREGLSINEIFAQKGEEYFRKVEKAVAKELSEKDNIVIDAGGGVVLDEENVSALKKTAKIICLTASVEAIYQRTKRHKHRPLLKVEDPKQKIEELLKLRAPYYNKIDIKIDTTIKSLPEVVQEVVNLTKC